MPVALVRNPSFNISSFDCLSHQKTASVLLLTLSPSCVNIWTAPTWIVFEAIALGRDYVKIAYINIPYIYFYQLKFGYIMVCRIFQIC